MGHIVPGTDFSIFLYCMSTCFYEYIACPHHNVDYFGHVTSGLNVCACAIVWLMLIHITTQLKRCTITTLITFLALCCFRYHSQISALSKNWSNWFSEFAGLISRYKCCCCCYCSYSYSCSCSWEDDSNSSAAQMVMDAFCLFKLINGLQQFCTNR